MNNEESTDSAYAVSDIDTIITETTEIMSNTANTDINSFALDTAVTLSRVTQCLMQSYNHFCLLYNAATAKGKAREMLLDEADKHIPEIKKMDQDVVNMMVSHIYCIVNRPYDAIDLSLMLNCSVDQASEAIKTILDIKPDTEPAQTEKTTEIEISGNRFIPIAFSKKRADWCFDTLDYLISLGYKVTLVFRDFTYYTDGFLDEFLGNLYGKYGIETLNKQMVIVHSGNTLFKRILKRLEVWKTWTCSSPKKGL